MCATYSNTYPIRPLLKAGAKLSEGDSQQNILLHMAAERNDVDLFKNVVMYHNVDRGADKEEALSEFTQRYLFEIVSVKLTHCIFEI